MIERIKTALFLVAILGFGSLFLDVSELIPESAPVVVDGREYLSSKCVSNDKWESSVKLTVSAAKKLGIKPSPACSRRQGFESKRWLLYHLLGSREKWD